MYRWRNILYRIASAAGISRRMVPSETHQQTLQEVVQVQLPRQGQEGPEIVVHNSAGSLDKVETSGITEPMKTTERSDTDSRQFKTSPKMLQFNLKDAELRAALVGMIGECQNQGVHFEMRQDGLDVVIEF